MADAPQPSPTKDVHPIALCVTSGLIGALRNAAVTDQLSAGRSGARARLGLGCEAHLETAVNQPACSDGINVAERARRAQQAAFAPRGANKMALRASRRDLCAGLMRSLCELRRRLGWLSMCRGRRRGFRPLLPHHLGTSSWPSGAACIERCGAWNRVARVHAVNTQNTKSASKRPAALRAALAVGRGRKGLYIHKGGSRHSRTPKELRCAADLRRKRN